MEHRKRSATMDINESKHAAVASDKDQIISDIRKELQEERLNHTMTKQEYAASLDKYSVERQQLDNRMTELKSQLEIATQQRDSMSELVKLDDDKVKIIRKYLLFLGWTTTRQGRESGTFGGAACYRA